MARLSLSVSQLNRLRFLSSRISKLEELTSQNLQALRSIASPNLPTQVWRRLQRLECRVTLLELDEVLDHEPYTEITALDNHIRFLEAGVSKLSRPDTENVKRVWQALEKLNCLKDAEFLRVADGDSYYKHLTLEQRATLLQAPSADHLCKTLLFSLDGGRYDEDEASSDEKFALVVVPYSCKIDNGKLRQGLKTLGLSSSQKTACVASPKRAMDLLGFPPNGVCFLGGHSERAATIPIIFAEVIAKLNPPCIYLGGGEINVKLRLCNIHGILRATQSHVLDITEPRLQEKPDDEEEQDGFETGNAPQLMAVHQSKSEGQASHSRKRTSSDRAEPDADREGSRVDLNFNLLDVRVGQIVSARRHPNSDKLLCEEIDIGEVTGPRKVVSGIQKFYNPEELLGKKVCVVTNLKPASLAGEPSTGMVLCASWKDGEKDFVKLVEPPSQAPIGSRILAPSCPIVEAANSNYVKKKKLFEVIAEELRLDDTGEIVTFQGKAIGLIEGSETIPIIVARGSPNARVF